MAKRYGYEIGDTVTGEVVQMLLDGRLRSGDRIDRNRFGVGVSWVPVQEALGQLERDRLVRAGYDRGGFADARRRCGPSSPSCRGLPAHVARPDEGDPYLPPPRCDGDRSWTADETRRAERGRSGAMAQLVIDGLVHRGHRASRRTTEATA